MLSIAKIQRIRVETRTVSSLIPFVIKTGVKVRAVPTVAIL